MRESFGSFKPPESLDKQVAKKIESGGVVEKKEHLKQGVKPIMACVGTPDDFEDCKIPLGSIDWRDTVDLREAKSVVGGYANVDYYADPRDLESKEFKNAGKGSYVISNIDSKNKLSISYVNCTGVIVSGQDKLTGENISFLSHQDPWSFVRDQEKQDKFKEDLKQRLEEMKGRCAEGTVDARIVGGNYRDNDPKTKEDYLKSIQLLSSEVNSVLDFDPTVITGPKRVGGEDNVFFDNDNKRLYISRTKVGDVSTEPFTAKDIEEQIKKILE
jgi:hypothetical protein